MSRLAKKPIQIPSGVEVTVANNAVTVKGSKATLTRTLHSSISVTTEADGVHIAQKDTTRLGRALVGTFAAHIRTMIAGVLTPFKKVLELNGVGYRVELKGTDLVFAVGFSHPVTLPVPAGITATVVKNVITLEGADKQAVGQFAAEVREIKPPEPYLGKGIKYQDEVIRRKQGKKSV
jgi:large subunit ribosomal protein L6